MGFFGNNVGDGLQADIESIKTDVLGIKSAPTKKDDSNTFPWTTTDFISNKNNPSTSVFMPPINVDWQRWNQLYPYRLVVIDTLNSNSIVGGNLNQTGEAPDPIISLDNSTLTFTPIENRWVFSLPITPQQLSITDQFAITTTATLRGVVEEHNGVKFKMISASGTMGVWPYRETVVKSPTSPGLIRSLFGGTLEALGSVVTGVTNTINALLNGATASKPITVNPEVSQAGPFSTGYYQALSFEQFLEQYAEAKKNPANSGWRLVFDIPKQNQSLVVSPIQFNWQQNANRPLEVNFTIQLKAWRRIDLTDLAPPTSLGVNQVSPGLIQTLLNTISAARTVMAQSINLIAAVRSDVDAPLQVLQQTSLLLKDASGVITTAADLPSSIAKDYQSAITDYLSNNSTAIQNANPDPQVAAALAAIQQDKASVEGLSSGAVSTGQVGTAAINLQNASPTNQIFSNLAANFTLLDAVPTSGLILNTAQQNALNTIFDQVRQLTVDDLRQFRNTISDLAYQISNNYGTGTSFYSEVYGKAPPNTRIQPLTLDEYEVLNALYGVLEAYDILTATTYFDDINQQTNMQYVAGLADASNIEFNISNSKIIAPVPFGLTVEGIAARYLNDPQRWLEIVTLNNLKEPYIDETGFQKPLLSNGTDRQVTTADSNDLYIGQIVTLKSTTQVPTPRMILGIDILSDSSVLITLDGSPNLDAFTTADQAYLLAYLPGTVNSQQKIFIPSDQEAPDADNITTPAAVGSDPLVAISKVDLLLTGDGDIATDAYGNFRLSAGITNLIQALNIKMGTIKGTILLHPEFGLGLRVGQPTSTFTAKNIYNTINKMVSDDPRFGGIKTLQIQLNKASVTINLSVFLVNGNGVLPLTYTLNI